MIKPIETEYAGHRFRSRLEARWAVFFDALGIRWHYEEEGFELPSGRYLPDFRLEQVARGGNFDVLCEVKGQLDRDGLDKLLLAALELPRRIETRPCPQILVLGEVPVPGDAWTHVRLDVLHDEVIFQVVYFGRDWASGPDHWVTRPIKDPIAFDRKWIGSWTEDQARDLCDWLTKPTEDLDLKPHATPIDAYRAARSARFEFGQSGATF